MYKKLFLVYIQLENSDIKTLQEIDTVLKENEFIKTIDGHSGTFNLPSGFYTIVVKFNETDTLTTSWHIQDKVFNLLVGLGVPKPLVVLVTQDDIAW
ncbi:MAG: hypothetical protein U0X41_03295 [Chitinophagales bacterium]